METTNEVMANNVNEIIETAASVIPEPIKSKPSVWSIVILIFAGIGVGSTGYFAYKGVKYAVTKLKDGSIKVQKVPEKPQKAEEAKEEPKAEEQPAE